MSKVATRTIQTPGEAPAEPQTDTPKPDAFAAVALQTGMDPEPGESEVDRLMRVVQAQQDQIAALTGAVQNIARGQQGHSPNAPAPASTLPDQASVDMATLEAPVLTRQGWLVPHEYGMSPEKRQENEDRNLTRIAMQKLAEKA